MTKLDGKAEIARQLGKEFAERLFAVFRHEGGRQLNENDLQFGRERLDLAQE